MPNDLTPLLNAYTSAALTAMHSFHGLAQKGPRPKNKMVADLSKALVERNRVLQSWNDLSPAERALVEGLLQREGEATQAYNLIFKFYQRVEGTFMVAPGAVVKKVQVRVLENGNPAPVSTQTVTLS